MTPDNSSEAEHQRMTDVDHTHPHTGRTFGTAFRRGPEPATDGGQPAAGESNSEANQTMTTVRHTPTNGADSSRAFRRGVSNHE